jgi:hypothetical protein
MARLTAAPVNASENSRPVSCAIPLGCSWAYSKGRKISREGCHRRRPKWGKQGILAARLTGVEEGDSCGGMDNRLWPFIAAHGRKEDGMTQVASVHGACQRLARHSRKVHTRAL